MTNSVIRLVPLVMFLAGLTAVAPLVPALAAGGGGGGWGSLRIAL